MNDWNFYFITDEKLTLNNPLEDARAAIQGGTRVVQYRKKRGETLDMYLEAKELRELTRQKGVDLIINDRMDIALAVGADGIHLGQKDLPLKQARKHFNGIIGVSIGSLEDLRVAEEFGADYVAVSPVWATPTKEDAGPGLGANFVEKVRKETDLHVTVIGGVKMENVRDLVKKGADSACAISATVVTQDVAQAVSQFEKAVAGAKKERKE